MQDKTISPKTLKNLPHLLRLLDDPSDLVQTALVEQLVAYSPKLEHALLCLDPPASPEQLRVIKTLLGADTVAKQTAAARELRLQWPRWRKEKSDAAQLLAAYSMLSSYMDPSISANDETDLPSRLTSLVSTYRLEWGSSISGKTLAMFLRDNVGLKGEHDSYYAPENSNLLQVLDQKTGLPISMAAIYILLGDQLGLPIRGCNNPGHFLARVDDPAGLYFVDCFDDWRFIDGEALHAHAQQAHPIVAEALLRPATSEEMIARVLANLSNAYLRHGKREQSELMLELRAL